MINAKKILQEELLEEKHLEALGVGYDGNLALEKDFKMTGGDNHVQQGNL